MTTTDQNLVQTFNYPVVSEDTLSRAIELDGKMNVTVAKLHYTVFEIGEIATEMKTLLPHGYFMKWYESKGLSRDQIRYAMNKVYELQNADFTYFDEDGNIVFENADFTQFGFPVEDKAETAAFLASFHEEVRLQLKEEPQQDKDTPSVPHPEHHENDKNSPVPQQKQQDSGTPLSSYSSQETSTMQTNGTKKPLLDYKAREHYALKHPTVIKVAPDTELFEIGHNIVRNGVTVGKATPLIREIPTLIEQLQRIYQEAMIPVVESEV